MSLDSDIAYLLALYDQHYPDPVDQFEDLLCGMLGVYRHPRIRYRASPLGEPGGQALRGTCLLLNS